jgi:hypothetical protein
MNFEEILDQALVMLQRQGRVTYRMLRRQLNLDEDTLDDLKADVSSDGRRSWISSTQLGKRPTITQYHLGLGKLYLACGRQDDAHVVR